MTDDLDQMGPIDYLVVEFPGNRMTGEGLPLLVDLVDRGIIRILDLVFVTQEPDGSITGWRSPTSTATASSTWPCSKVPSSGLSDQDDIDEAAWSPGAGQLGRHPGLRERVGGAVRHGRCGVAAAQLVASGRIPVQAPGRDRAAERAEPPPRRRDLR